jgi:hypothetical protein
MPPRGLQAAEVNSADSPSPAGGISAVRGRVSPLQFMYELQFNI